MSSSEARLIFTQMRLESQLNANNSGNDDINSWVHKRKPRTRRNSEYICSISGRNNATVDIHSNIYPKYISNKTEILRRRRSTSFCLELQEKYGDKGNYHSAFSGEHHIKPFRNSNKDQNTNFHIQSTLLSPVKEGYHQHRRDAFKSSSQSSLPWLQKIEKSTQRIAPQDHNVKQIFKYPGHDSLPKLQKVEKSAQRISLPDLKPNTHMNWTQHIHRRRNSLAHSISFEMKEHISPRIVERNKRSSSEKLNDAPASQETNGSNVWKLKREHSFEITFPGYDSRFQEYSPMCIAVDADMDRALQQLREATVEKCTKWLNDVPTTTTRTTPESCS